MYLHCFNRLSSTVENRGSGVGSLIRTYCDRWFEPLVSYDAKATRPVRQNHSFSNKYFESIRFFSRMSSGVHSSLWYKFPCTSIIGYYTFRLKEIELNPNLEVISWRSHKDVQYWPVSRYFWLLCFSFYFDYGKRFLVEHFLIPVIPMNHLVPCSGSLVIDIIRLTSLQTLDLTFWTVLLQYCHQLQYYYQPLMSNRKPLNHLCLNIIWMEL